MNVHDVEFTKEELEGLAQFEASFASTPLFRRQITLQALRTPGGMQHLTGTPRREVLEEMARRLAAYNAANPR